MMGSYGVWGLSLILFLSLGWTKAQRKNFTRPVFRCGGDLVAESGFVGSEGFPSFYKPNSKCTWHITVPEGNVVKLSFRIFDMEADSQCRYDYLDVYNGNSNLVQKLGRFCGTFRPGALISTTNTMMLEMVTDGETHGRGFVGYFSGTKPYADDQQFCGGKMTKSKGELKTPNWPDQKYPPGTSCSWLIMVEPDMVIQVKFDKFLVEADPYCRFDYVAFFNGGEKDDSRLIGKYCGDQNPQPIISSGNVLLVQFVSDLSVTSDGFLAHYTSIPLGSQVSTDYAGAGTRSVPPKPKVKPSEPELPGTTAQPPVPTEKPKPVKPTRGRGTSSQGRRVSTTGQDRRVSNTGQDRRVSTTGQDKKVSNTGQDRRAGTTDQNRRAGTTDQDRRVTTTDQDRRFSTTNQDKRVSTTEQDKKVSTTDQDSGVSTTDQDKRVSTTDQDSGVSTRDQDKQVSNTDQDSGVSTAEQDKGVSSTDQDRRAPVPGTNGKRPVSQNPLCARECKRPGAIKSSFCASEFVITGTVTSMMNGPRGALHLSVSVIKTYKAGRLVITQIGETMSVKVVSLCRKCPLFRRGGNYIIMGQVDEDGRGTLEPGSFTAPYKAPHHRLLMNINNQPC